MRAAPVRVGWNFHTARPVWKDPMLFHRPPETLMPHDKKGRLVEVGDHVAFKDYDGTPHVGKVTTVAPSTDTCNANVSIVVPMPTASTRCITLKDSDLVRKADGSEPSPWIATGPSTGAED